MAPPIVTATIQTAIIGAISNILAQTIAAYQSNSPFQLDPIPIFQYTLFALISTPPNFLWQEFLESSFPAYDTPPSTTTATTTSEKSTPAALPPKLNKLNTLLKTLLDQSLGAALNTLLFSTFMHSIRQGMAHHQHSSSTTSSLLGVDAVRYGAVQWPSVWTAAKAEFWPLVKAGWRFWPLVSLVNYVFLTSVEARSLVGALAGLGWGVYVSLVTGQ